MVQIQKKVFYSGVILYEKKKQNPKKKKSKKVIFGGLPAFFVEQKLAKMTNLNEFPSIKEISKIC